MRTEDITGIVLAGGRSSRMGTDKAELTLGGRSLLAIQVEKLRSLGIEDIIISGHDNPPAGTRQVMDLYPGRGPLAGLHACMKATQKPACLVISVDVPLVPAESLARLVQYHKAQSMNTGSDKAQSMNNESDHDRNHKVWPKQAQSSKAVADQPQIHEGEADSTENTENGSGLVRRQEGEAAVLAHGQDLEPLIAVYDTSLAQTIEECILAGKGSVHGLLRSIKLKKVEYTGPPELLQNCNRPEDYEKARFIFEKKIGVFS